MLVCSNRTSDLAAGRGLCEVDHGEARLGAWGASLDAESGEMDGDPV